MGQVISNMLGGTITVDVPTAGISWFWMGISLVIAVAAIVGGYFVWKRLYGTNGEAVIDVPGESPEQTGEEVAPRGLRAAVVRALTGGKEGST